MYDKEIVLNLLENMVIATEKIVHIVCFPVCPFTLFIAAFKESLSSAKKCKPLSLLPNIFIGHENPVYMSLPRIYL